MHIHSHSRKREPQLYQNNSIQDKFLVVTGNKFQYRYFKESRNIAKAAKNNRMKIYRSRLKVSIKRGYYRVQSSVQLLPHSQLVVVIILTTKAQQSYEKSRIRYTVDSANHIEPL